MIIRVKKNKNYTVICNECLQRPDISLKAKGLFAYLMSLPDNWKIHKKELVNHFKDGTTSINSAFKELEKAGYIITKHIRDKKGRFADVEYIIKESINPITENLISDSLISENQPLQNTNKNKILKKQNTKIISSEVKTSEALPTSSGHSLNVPEEKPFITIPIVQRNPNDPLEYPIYEQDIQEWQETFPGVNVRQELKKIRLWNKDNPRRRKTKNGIRRHITTWLSKAQDKGRRSSGETSKPKPRTPDWY